MEGFILSFISDICRDGWIKGWMDRWSKGEGWMEGFIQSFISDIYTGMGG